MDPEPSMTEQTRQMFHALIAEQMEPLRAENQRLQNELTMLRNSMQTGVPGTSTQAPIVPKAPKSPPIIPFEGDQDKWDAFVTQIKLKFVEYPYHFSTDRQKVVYFLQWMQKRTAPWASSYLEQVNSLTPAPELDNWDIMLSTATTAWGIHDRQGQAEQKLIGLSQEGTVSTYRSEFQQLAQITKWNDEALCRRFHDGLKRNIQYGLLSMPKWKNLQELIQNSLDYETRWLETRASTRRPKLGNFYPAGTNKPARDPNAMEVDASRLSPEEQERHFKQGLCFICHKAGHMAINCPDRRRNPKAYKARASVVEDKEAEFEKEVQKRLAAALKDFQKGQE